MIKVFLSASAVALTVASPAAIAQSGTADHGKGGSQATQSIQDIVVTAQRLEKTAQRAGIAIGVGSGEKLTKQAWEVAAFVRNMEDNRVLLNAPVYDAASSLQEITSAPRTYGVRASVKI